MAALFKFEVFGHSMDAFDDGAKVTVTLKFRRMFLFHLTNTYMPCLFLVTMSRTNVFGSYDYYKTF